MSSALVIPQRAIKWDVINSRAVAFKPIVQHALAMAVTLAQINAGFTVEAAVPGRTIRPIRVLLVVHGTFLTLTDVRLSDTAGTPVDIVTIAQVNLTDASRFGDLAATGLTFGAGYLAALGVGQGIQIRKTGTAGTGGTSIDVSVEYEITSAGFQAGFGT